MLRPIGSQLTLLHIRRLGALRDLCPRRLPRRWLLIFGGMGHGRPLAPSRSASRCIVESTEDDPMNLSKRWHRHAVLALVLVAILVAPLAQLGRVAGAQEATP